MVAKAVLMYEYFLTCVDPIFRNGKITSTSLFELERVAEIEPAV